MERWKEYEAGKLRPGDIVQQDEIRDETLYWVLTEQGIVGPLSRHGKHSEAEVVESALALAKTPPPEPEPDYRAKYETLQADIKAIDPKATKEAIVAALTKLQTATAVEEARR